MIRFMSYLFSTEITVFPDREPEVVVLYRDKDRYEPYYDGKTIDAVYQRIANDTANLKDFTAHIWYNKYYHYPKFYTYYPKVPDDVPVEETFDIIITEFEPLGE